MSAPDPATPDPIAMAHDAMPFTRLLGVEITEATPDVVRARLPWSPDRCTAGGMLHGGALMGLADSCGGLLAFLNLPDGATATTTLTSTTSFLRGLGEGHANATCRPVHRGRTTIVVETEAVDDNGNLLAKVTQTQAVLRAD